VIEMDKYSLEVSFLTLNKHGNLLMTSLALNVHRAHFESLVMTLPYFTADLCQCLDVKFSGFFPFFII
jgi:hypothetical protein